MNRLFASLVATSLSLTVLTSLPAPSIAQGSKTAPSTAKQAPTLYVYDFYAVWCHNCTAIKPALTALQNKYRGTIQVVPVDIDAEKNQQLVARAGVAAVPTLVIVDRQGRPLKTFVGADEARQLEPTLGLLLNPTPAALVPRPAGT